MRRLACAYLPHWPITRLRQASSLDKPIVAAETIRGRRRLASVGPVAADLGLQPGQTLAHARALCPDIVIVEADPQADAAALVRLASWCERYTPLVAVDPPESLWLDITGCPITDPDGGQRFAQDIIDRLQAIGIPCRVAVAGTTGAAWVLAHVLRGEQRSTILAPGKEQTALAGLPIAALRLDPGIVARLHRVGLRTIGELLRLPRSDLTSRFGPMLALRLDQALGHVEEALAWLHPSIEWQERLDFVEPIGTPDDLARALTLLAERLCRRLGEHDSGAHRFVAHFYCTDAQVPRIAVATNRAVRDAAHIGKLLREKLGTVDPGFGIDVIVLMAEDIAPLGNEQIGLDVRTQDNQARTDAGGEMARLLDTLGNRLGQDRLWCMAPRESRQPERRVVRVTPAAGPVCGWTEGQETIRPIRLLRRPEPIEVTALLPDAPPAQFHWRRVAHRVRTATGPERIAHEWWQRPGEAPDAYLIRDYYRVEDQDGARFWISRAGLHGEGCTPQWYLHGLFA